ncbi:uncharacterized protein [Solanum tuberosum]|uniref:uncharacterized protein n=1 Tax=Solanum tuberosum TaxID=4113 RepID=UPI0003D2815B|nr:PREDICTED: uncharacterized protein LOC102589232 [Solanum tuberosum]
MLAAMLKQYLEPCFDFQVCSTRGTSDCVDTSLMLVRFHSLTLFDECMQQFKRCLFAPTPAVHVAAAGSAAFFSGEQCCISSLLCGGPVSFQLLVVLMVKIAGSIMIWLNENWICPHEKKEKPAYIEPEDEV